MQCRSTQGFAYLEKLAKDGGSADKLDASIKSLQDLMKISKVATKGLSQLEKLAKEGGAADRIILSIKGLEDQISQLAKGISEIPPQPPRPKQGQPGSQAPVEVFPNATQLPDASKRPNSETNVP